jgi:organic hydroperoxide reductase OsmC/OhrA
MHYEAHVIWTGNRGSGTSSYTSYSRDYDVAVDGKPPLAGSADAKFRGAADRHNPEDLLVIALTSCHMLAYLALCARGGITVVGYTDRATGSMELRPGGGGHFVEVALRPVVTIANAADADRAAALHHSAHEGCFIASSCNFPVRHEATIRVAEELPA